MKKGMQEPLYRIWYSMKARCYRQSHNRYKYYGARGITVCDKWLKYEGFYEDMNKDYKPGLTLDRIECNGNYEKNNCRWATQKEQQNNRRNNIIIDTPNGRMTLAQYADLSGIKYKTLYGRLKAESR